MFKCSFRFMDSCLIHVYMYVYNVCVCLYKPVSMHVSVRVFLSLCIQLCYYEYDKRHHHHHHHQQQPHQTVLFIPQECYFISTPYLS